MIAEEQEVNIPELFVFDKNRLKVFDTYKFLPNFNYPLNYLVKLLLRHLHVITCDQTAHHHTKHTQWLVLDKLRAVRCWVADEIQQAMFAELQKRGCPQNHDVVYGGPIEEYRSAQNDYLGFRTDSYFYESGGYTHCLGMSYLHNFEGFSDSVSGIGPVTGVIFIDPEGKEDRQFFDTAMGWEAPKNPEAIPYGVLWVRRKDREKCMFNTNDRGFADLYNTAKTYKIRNG